jgi:hypothetical protein
VKAFVEFAVPKPVVTLTVCAPAVPEGVTAVIEVAVLPDTVAGAPPTVTVALVKFVPVIVIVVPPVAGPVEGETDAIVGTGISV